MATLPVLDPAPTPLDESRAAALAHRFGVLADPVRLRLLALVSTSPVGEVCACVLPDAVDRSQSTVSHHMGRLVDAGLVTRTQRGKWAWYRADPAALDGLRDVLGHELRHPARRPCMVMVDMDGGGRSLMAAGWARHLAGDAVRVVAAAADAAAADGHLAPATAAMAEAGVGVAGIAPRRWTVDLAQAADMVVCVGCEEPDGVPPGTRALEWDVDDPREGDDDVLRRVRDQVRSRVADLVAEFMPSCCGTPSGS